MFYDTGNFKELKGSCFNSKMKRKFIDYFCQNDLFELYFIHCDNKKVTEQFYQNTSRAFNYVLKKAIEYFTIKRFISYSNNYFFIDERNIKTNTKSTLEEYLNTELVTGSHIQKDFKIEYCASETRELIQIADVFSNIYYNNLITNGCYKKELDKMIEEGYIKSNFVFPLN